MTELETRYDLWGEGARIDPLPILARMRAEAPIVRLHDPHQGAPEWVVTRYDDALALLHDERFIKDKRRLSDAARGRYFRVTELDRLDQHMLFADPPNHTRLRTLVAKGFTPRRVAELRPRVAAVAERLVDRLADGEVDLLESFAFPLPVAVIAELIGVPASDQDRFREWTRILVSHPEDGDFAPLRRMANEFEHYLDGFLDDRRRTPRDDLASALVHAEQDGERLTSVELASMIFLLIVAGYETTGNLIGNGIWALLRHPDQLDRIRAEPALAEPAVEEVLRYCGPVKNTTGAFALADLEFRGQRIPAEEKIVASLLSANHDPQQFPEPDRFDLDRGSRRHLGFGHGIHFCLGASLARLEAATAIQTLVARLPDLTFGDDPGALRWRLGVFVHGLERLPVTVGERSVTAGTR